jgi:preprotein translocase subunit SecG
MEDLEYGLLERYVKANDYVSIIIMGAAIKDDPDYFTYEVEKIISTIHAMVEKNLIETHETLYAHRIKETAKYLFYQEEIKRGLAKDEKKMKRDLEKSTIKSNRTSRITNWLIVIFTLGSLILGSLAYVKGCNDKQSQQEEPPLQSQQEQKQK